MHQQHIFGAKWACNWVPGHVALWSKEGYVYILSFDCLAVTAMISKEVSHDKIYFFYILSLLHYFEFDVVLKIQLFGKPYKRELKYSYLTSHARESCNSLVEMSRRRGRDAQGSQLIKHPNVTDLFQKQLCISANLIHLLTHVKMFVEHYS